VGPEGAVTIDWAGHEARAEMEDKIRFRIQQYLESDAPELVMYRHQNVRANNACSCGRSEWSPRHVLDEMAKGVDG
jgi:hypothetical protein